MYSEIKKTLQESIEINQEIYNLIKQDKNSTYSHRKIFSISAYQVCLSHCQSTLHLLKCGVVATPLSLLRVLFEAFIRASWLCKVATETQLQEFKDGKFIKFPAKNIIITSIKLSSFIDGESIENTVNEHKELFDDFTHTGDMQILRRINEIKRNINENFKKKEILFIICFTSKILTNSIIEILELEERFEQIKIAKIKYEELITLIESQQ
ncbi:DUF6988 family protein [Alcaligenes faecalis]|uniref:DUF6988 family protein n=1 Tax=Alcaligenes faecalis TaxID=511 RepID=UPI0024BD0867|nr:DUF5677 domain-containing protein [Alcaligenes faecalis]WHQ44193.1 hypothetical protein E8D21_11615 [Alcaligenes faecalis]